MNPALCVDRAVFEIIYISSFFFTVSIVKSECLAKKFKVGGKDGVEIYNSEAVTV